MHRVIHIDGSIKQSEFVRWSLAAAYLMFASAGFLMLLSSELLSVYGRYAIVMAWFITIGSVISMAGCVCRFWVGEFLGGPLLSVGLITLGLLTWKSTYQSYPFIATGNLALFIGIASVAIARWRVVFAVQRFVHSMAIRGKRHAT